MLNILWQAYEHVHNARTEGACRLSRFLTYSHKKYRKLGEAFSLVRHLLREEKEGLQPDNLIHSYTNGLCSERRCIFVGTVQS